MRKLPVPIIILVLLSTAVSSAAEPGKEPKYSSEKPLRANLVLDEKGTKVLTLAFDESQGTGKGYDRMYADLNLNGDLTDDSAIKAAFQQGRRQWRGTCSFPAIRVHGAYNEMAKGSWQIAAHFSRYQRSRFLGLVKGEVRDTFVLEANLRMQDEAGEWKYLWHEMLAATELAEGKSLPFGGKASLDIQTKPDPHKKGNTGIAAPLVTGRELTRCTRNNEPITAHVLITNQQEKTIHSEDVSLDKLVFG